MKKTFAIMLALMLAFSLFGCSGKETATSNDYDSLQKELDELKADNDTLTAETKDLKAQIEALNAENETLKNQMETSDTANDVPAEVDMTEEELDAKLMEQPMYIISTDYLIQSDDLKSLYPDMLSGVIKNVSGNDVKNAVVSFVAWDKNKFPVKVKGQFDFSGGSYVQTVNYGDVNMLDGDTYGENMGLSLSDDCDNIEYLKAIVMEYTDFDGNKWENPYYKSWITLYENKKLSN